MFLCICGERPNIGTATAKLKDICSWEGNTGTYVTLWTDQGSPTGCVVAKDLLRHMICCQWPKGSTNQLASHGTAAIMHLNLLMENGRGERKVGSPGELFHAIPNDFHL